ncbi:hypothetical protein GCM10027059_26190 [Myceligenerans halotolerans]
MNALIEEGLRAERKLRALEALAEVVGDAVTEPDCPPDIRDAYRTFREAIAS